MKRPELAPLILVVGPSGAGKDTLLAGAAQALTHRPRIVFARRRVTRKTGGFGEDPSSPEEFAEVESSGGFLLSWHAHGLAYGVPASVQSLRETGSAVVVNVSRTVIGVARRKVFPVGIIAVTAPVQTLAQRLVDRGREDAEDIGRRLRRAEEDLPGGPDVRVVVNDGTVEAGVTAFLDALEALTADI